MIDASLVKHLDSLKLGVYRSPAYFGYGIEVDPYSPKATDILNIVEPYITKCQWIGKEPKRQPTKGAYFHHYECGLKAVRVGVFETVRTGDKPMSAFVGLCRKHKNRGLWNG